jgi:hypothetical protein
VTITYGATERTDYTPPNGSLCVHPTLGDDHNDGRASSPLQTIRRASELVPHNGTIVLFSSEQSNYRENVPGIWAKNFTIQAAPGTRPRWVGWEPARSWTREGDYWYHAAPVFDHNPRTETLVDPQRNPYAAWPETVWRDGVPLRLGSAETADSFGLHLAGSRVYVSFDPTEHDMRIAHRQVAFTGALNQPDPSAGAVVNFRGITFEGFANGSRQFAAVRIYGPHTLVEQCEFIDCGTGIATHRGDGIMLLHNTFRRCGQLGSQAYLARHLEIGGCLYEGNNRSEYSHIGEAGGAKWTYSTDVHVHHTRAAYNHGHALWADADSDRCLWTRCVAEDNDGAGIYFEMSQEGGAYGCYAARNQHGIYASAARAFDVRYCTAVDNQDGRDIEFNEQDQRPTFPQGGHWRSNNQTTGADDTLSPTTDNVADLLELVGPERAAAYSHRGWYGPEYTPPQEPPPMPEPYDLFPMIDDHQQLGEEIAKAGAEIRRLEGLLSADPDLALIEQLRSDLHNTAVALMHSAQESNAKTVTITTLNSTVIGLQQQVSGVTSQLNALTRDHADLAAAMAVVEQERDTALASNEEAQELLGEALADNTRQRGELDDLTRRVRDALAAIDDLTERLAECEADHGPAPLIVGGSHPNGWAAHKAMTAPEVPAAHRYFARRARLTVADLDETDAIAGDGALPYISVRIGSPDDTSFNVGALMEQGITRGAYIIAHEPTQKITAAEYKAMQEACLPIVRDGLPDWERLLVFMAYDFRDPEADRHPGHGWLPDDLTLITGIGVDVYDKAKNAADRRTFAELMTPVEDFTNTAREITGVDLTIHICEASAPDTGQYERPPGWKPTWLRGAYLHMQETRKADGTPRYGSLLVFNGMGPDAPPAVGDIPAGWGWGSTPEALAAYRDVINPT